MERPVGTDAVMATQLQQLNKEAATDHVTIQVLPKSAGASPAMDGPFSVLTLPDPIPDFAYAEGPGGGNCVEVAALDDDHIAVRNSNHPDRGPMLFTPTEMSAWIQGCQAGEFDDLT